MSEPMTIQLEIPKTHPGLPRLLEATKRLPHVEMQGEHGVSFTKRSLHKPGVFEDFFEALGDVIGEHHASDMQKALLGQQSLQNVSQEALMNLARHLRGSPFLAALQLLGS